MVGGGSRARLGLAVRADKDLDMSALSGIHFYEPGELVMSAGAGTPLVDIVAALAEAGQHLAFEPPDWGALFAGACGRTTIGGVFATNASGSRRFQAGAARDHLLGFQAVNGRGERFVSGGRVIKNVSGYDLSKLLCGSFGTLAVFTEVTFKVFAPRHRVRHVAHSRLGRPRRAGGDGCPVFSVSAGDRLILLSSGVC